MITDEKKEEIKKQSKTILSNFAKSLEKVKLKGKKEKKELGGFREEGEPSRQDSDFRKRMFDNASNKDEECIIAERAKW